MYARQTTHVHWYFHQTYKMLINFVCVHMHSLGLCPLKQFFKICLVFHQNSHVSPAQCIRIFYMLFDHSHFALCGAHVCTRLTTYNVTQRKSVVQLAKFDEHKHIV